MLLGKQLPSSVHWPALQQDRIRVLECGDPDVEPGTEGLVSEAFLVVPGGDPEYMLMINTGKAADICLLFPPDKIEIVKRHLQRAKKKKKAKGT